MTTKEKFDNGTGEQTMIELKPCPFCGSSNILHSLSFGWMHGVMCGNCGAEFTKCKTQKDAEEKWNRRADND